MNKILHIKDLFVSVEGNKIINNFNISLHSGEIHAIMGPNGSGKSSLAYSLMGHPKYLISSGDITYFNKNIKKISVDKRAKNGMFLAFQYPIEIPGATAFSVLKESYVAITGKLISVSKFSEILFRNMDILNIDHSFAYRSLNEGFSGGEKKKFEILQMLILKPKLAILDEIDSGLDIDSLKIVAEGILHAKKENPAMGLLIITHYQHILRHLQPDVVHIMHNGNIIKSGNYCLVKEIEEKGYNGFIDGKNGK